jgi:NADP-dependent 3-hydroxy acid dehydrogenase YdfG
MDNNKQKIAFVTGASSGIGKAMAEHLSEEGYYVYAAARRMDKLEALKSENVEPVQMDVTDSKAVIKAVEHISASKGRLDLLVNNAGYGIYGTIEGVSREDVRKAFDVNVFGLGHLTQTVLPIMRNQQSGMIINVSSVVGKISLPFLGWYSATKHALEGLTDALRAEVKPYGIKVVLIEPGSINTGFEDVAMATLEKSNDPEVYAKHKVSFAKTVKHSYKSAPGSEAVIKEFQKIIKSSRPRARYVAGKEGKMFLALKGMVSDMVFDFLVSKQYK